MISASVCCPPLVFCFLLLTGLPTGASQDRIHELYVEVNDKNFKTYQPFHEKINSESFDHALANACLFHLTNDARKKNGKKPLPYSLPLETAAWYHSKAMLDDGFFDHENPYDAARATPEERAKLAGAGQPFIAENIAANSGQAPEMHTYFEMAAIFVKQWLESPGHKKNILSDKGVSMGCGIYIIHDEWVATQCFQWFSPIEPMAPKDILPYY